MPPKKKQKNLRAARDRHTRSSIPEIEATQENTMKATQEVTMEATQEATIEANI